MFDLLLVPKSELPEWVHKIVPFGGEWELAASVVVGDLANIRYLGRERILQEWVNGLHVDRPWLYWCAADLKWDFLVTGTPPPAGRSYVWSESYPGCNPHRFDRGIGAPILRVWLLRDDGRYLRPVTDTFGSEYYAFRTEVKIEPGAGSAAEIGRLLLTPSAASNSVSSYSNIFWGAASLARDLLTPDEFHDRILQLTHSGDPDLRSKACQFLALFLKESCAN